MPPVVFGAFGGIIGITSFIAGSDVIGTIGVKSDVRGYCPKFITGFGGSFEIIGNTEFIGAIDERCWVAGSCGIGTIGVKSDVCGYCPKFITGFGGSFEIIGNTEFIGGSSGIWTIGVKSNSSPPYK